MNKVDKDEQRDERISMEIIVDAYGPEEQAMGWYYYLEDNLDFPFQGHCITEHVLSPLRKGEEVEVVAMVGEAACRCEMFVEIEWMDRRFGVPLAQLKAVGTGEEGEEAILDWHYWVGRGYQIC